MNISFLLDKATELQVFHKSFSPAAPFVVSCENWNEKAITSQLAFDFYAVKEINPTEGRVTAISAGYFWRSRWVVRSGNEVDFWVKYFDPEFRLYQMRYFHPENSIQEDTALSRSPVILFNYADKIEQATVQNRIRDRVKNKLTKKRREQCATPLLFQN